MEHDDLPSTPERRFSRRINSRESTNGDCSSIENTPKARNICKTKTKSKEKHAGKIGYVLYKVSNALFKIHPKRQQYQDGHEISKQIMTNHQQMMVRASCYIKYHILNLRPSYYYGIDRSDQCRL